MYFYDMKDLEKQIKSMKADIFVLRVLVYAIIAYVGFSLGRNSAEPKTDNAGQQTYNHPLYNSTEERRESVTIVFDSIATTGKHAAVY